MIFKEFARLLNIKEWAMYDKLQKFNVFGRIVCSVFLYLLIILPLALTIIFTSIGLIIVGIIYLVLYNLTHKKQYRKSFEGVLMLVGDFVNECSETAGQCLEDKQEVKLEKERKRV